MRGILPSITAAAAAAWCARGRRAMSLIVPARPAVERPDPPLDGTYPAL